MSKSYDRIGCSIYSSVILRRETYLREFILIELGVTYSVNLRVEHAQALVRPVGHQKELLQCNEI